jgi:flagellar biosynthesis regulator FlbT
MTTPEQIKRLKLKQMHKLYTDGQITYFDYREGVLLLINIARFSLGIPVLTPEQLDRTWQLHTLAAEDWKQARYEIADAIAGCNY